MSLIDHHIVLNFDSGFAEQTYDNGSRFRATLNPPLEVSPDAVMCEASVPQANVWYSFVNLGQPGDKFSFSYRGVAYEYDIPKGRYDVAAIEAMMNRAVAISGVNPGAQELFSLYGDAATGRVHLGVYAEDATAVTVVDFTPASSVRLRELLGYDSSAMTFDGVTGGGVRTLIPDDVARFSELSYVTISSNLFYSGYNQQGALGRQLAVITPNVAVGSLIKHEPFVPLKYNAEGLIGRPIDTMEFDLRDSSNLPVDTNGETWNFRLMLKYQTPYEAANQF